MTRYYLSEIKIEGFRGINNDGDPLVIRLRPDAVNSIHAPNGVGKTSIFEAIHFALFGTVPRLKKLQASERPEAYVANRFHRTGQAAVGLAFLPDDGSPRIEINVERSRVGIRTITSPTGQPDPEAFLKDLREDFVLVDYSKFSEFIDASALQRGRSFASLVGLSKYSDMRRAIEGAADTRTLNSDFDIRAIETDITAREREIAGATARALSAYSEITGNVSADLADIGGMCAAVTAALRGIELLRPVIGANDVRSIDLSIAEKVVESAEGGTARKRQSELQQAIAALGQLGPSPADKTERITILNVAAERDTALAKVGNPLLRDLYERARAVVGDTAWDNPKKCPVCETTLTKSLDEHLQEKIEKYAAADAANERLEQLILGAGCIDRLARMENSVALAVAGGDRMHATIIRAARDRALATSEINAAMKRLDEAEAKRGEVLRSAQAELAAIEKSLPPSLVAVTKKLASVKEFCDAIGLHHAATAVANEKKRALAIRERWKNFIVAAKDAFCAAEASLANDRIMACEGEHQALFGSLVRGGPNVRPTLERAAGSENVDLTLADFHGQSNINARAVLSESYRNAVAASIFLAAATRYNGAPRFVILDDITSSFDAGHQFSLMEAIRTKLQQPANADGLQFIILSHDTALEKYFDKQSGSADWHHQKLQGMPPIGKVMISAQHADRLKNDAQAQLNAGQIDLGAPLLRQYLEYKLGLIISRLEIPCPPDYATRGDKRTVSTYLDAIIEAIDLYQAANRCVLAPGQVNDIKNTHVPAIVGNFVTHYETGAGTPFNAYALLGVLQSIDDLADCFMWEDTSTTPPVKKLYRRLDRRS